MLCRASSSLQSCLSVKICHAPANQFPCRTSPLFKKNQIKLFKRSNVKYTELAQLAQSIFTKPHGLCNGSLRCNHNIPSLCLTDSHSVSRLNWGLRFAECSLIRCISFMRIEKPLNILNQAAAGVFIDSPSGIEWVESGLGSVSSTGVQSWSGT